MHRLAPAGVDPLAGPAPLAFVFSPLVGTPLTTSAKFAVVAKSPLTGRLNDALASSHFAIAGKLTGHDAIVVRGDCAQPSILLVDRDGARARAGGRALGAGRRRGGGARPRRATARAGEWRDRPGRRAPGALRHRLARRPPRRARRARAPCWARSGSRRSPSARPACPLAVADPVAVLALARDLRERSFGPATAKYRELGTLANLLSFNAISTLPTRNFQAAALRRGAASSRPRSCTACARWRGRLRLVHDRLRAHLRGAAAARARAWSTRTCSPSARCAACPTRTPCSPPARAATSSGSTPSRPAGRSPGPWSAPSAA